MEYRRKCTVCGKIYCYTDSDVFDNNADKVTAALSGIATVAQLFGGTMLGAYAMSSQRDRYDQRVKDFTRCPYCNSQSTIELTASQWIEEQRLIGTGKTTAQLPQSSKPHIEINANATTESLLKRVHLFLEDSEWDMADAYCDKILDVDPENSLAYLGKLMAETHSNNLDGLSRFNKDFEESGNYKKAVRFADPGLKAELAELVKQRDYNRAMMAMVSAKSKADYEKAANMFRRLSGFLYADEEAKECLEKAKEAEKKETYAKADSLAKKDDIPNLERAILVFDSLGDWKDSKERSESCKYRIIAIQQEAKEAEILAIKKKKRAMIIVASTAAFVVFAVAAFFVITKVFIPYSHYKQAEALLTAGDYTRAISGFRALGDYKDSSERILECNYAKAGAQLEEGYYDGAISGFRSLGEYKDSSTRVLQSVYLKGDALFKTGNYGEAISCFKELGTYSDSNERLQEAQYAQADSFFANNELNRALMGFKTLGNYNDSPNRVEEVQAEIYTQAKDAFNSEDYPEALRLLALITDCQDVSSFTENVKSGTYNAAIEAFQKRDWEKARTLFNSITDYRDTKDYRLYLQVNSINYNDGKIHDLSVDYRTIMSIENDELRGKLLQSPQMQTLLLLEGKWYKEKYSYSSWSGKERDLNNYYVFNGGTITKYSSGKVSTSEYSLLYRNGGYYDLFWENDYYYEKYYYSYEKISEKGFDRVYVSKQKKETKTTSWSDHFVR